MKKLLLISATMLIALTAFGQKPSKAEREEAERLAYEAAVESMQAKTFVLVPSSYQNSDGDIVSQDNNDVFLSAEGEKMYSQGWCVCGNGNTNVGEATSYECNIDKKGNVKLVINVSGRFWRGTYTIKMRKNKNVADVIFTQPNKPTLRFTGPVVPLVGADYYKRSNPL